MTYGCGLACACIVTNVTHTPVICHTALHSAKGSASLPYRKDIAFADQAVGYDIQSERKHMTSVKVQTEQGYRTAINVRQHTVYADELINDGGTDTAPTPMEILLGTAGACIAVTVKAYAQRKGWPLTGVAVELDMERIKREDYPDYTGDAAFVHEIREVIRFEGDLTDEQKNRLHLVAKKCPVHLTLENPVFFVENQAAVTDATL